MKLFKFDYDEEQDSLFIYNPDMKSKASVDLKDLVIDFSPQGHITSVEILDASNFFNAIHSSIPITKKQLQQLSNCQVDVVQKNNLHFFTFVLQFKDKTELTTPLIIPSLSESSPVLAAL